MRNTLSKTILLALFVLFTLPAFSHAGMQHSLGVDVIRMVDKAQYDGMFNLYYQLSLNKRSAIVAGFSSGDDVTIGEVGYKFYLKKYFDGPYGKIGANLGDYDGDTEFGVSAAIGYEKSIVRHFVIGCAVELIAGSMDNYATGDNDPIFRPVLNAIFAF